MSALSSLWERLSNNKGYRETFVGSVVKRMIPLQIRVLRKQRDWSQAVLAKESKLTQGVISRAEDPEYGNLTINTLVRIAAGFDCAFIGRFVPFSELGRWYSKLENEDELQVRSFRDDAGFMDQKEPKSDTLNPDLWQRGATDLRFRTGQLGKSTIRLIPARLHQASFDFENFEGYVPAPALIKDLPSRRVA